MNKATDILTNWDRAKRAWVLFKSVINLKYTRKIDNYECDFRFRLSKFRKDWIEYSNTLPESYTLKVYILDELEANELSIEEARSKRDFARKHICQKYKYYLTDLIRYLNKEELEDETRKINEKVFPEIERVLWKEKEELNIDAGSKLNEEQKSESVEEREGVEKKECSVSIDSTQSKLGDVSPDDPKGRMQELEDKANEGSIERYLEQKYKHNKKPKGKGNAQIKIFILEYLLRFFLERFPCESLTIFEYKAVLSMLCGNALGQITKYHGIPNEFFKRKDRDCLGEYASIKEGEHRFEKIQAYVESLESLTRKIYQSAEPDYKKIRDLSASKNITG